MVHLAVRQLPAGGVGRLQSLRRKTYPQTGTIPVSSRTFQAAFPQNKVQDCVVFCQKEILTYIHDNLTSKIETNPRHTTNDDAEAKFERVVISSLQGYCLYLNTLTNEQIEKSADLNSQIITNSRFLKLATHKTPVIRATWFKVLATLYHRAGFLLAGEHAHVVPIVFNNLDESEPAVVGFVWEAALLVMDLGEVRFYAPRGPEQLTVRFFRGSGLVEVRPRGEMLFGQVAKGVEGGGTRQRDRHLSQSVVAFAQIADHGTSRSFLRQFLRKSTLGVCFYIYFVHLSRTVSQLIKIKQKSSEGRSLFT